jgi:hypothetical protein
MVYPEILYFVVASGMIIITTILLTPVLYTFWNDDIRPQINQTNDFGKRMVFVGDLMFTEFQILGFLTAGIVMAWGIASAARKGTQYDVPNEA